MENKDIIGRLVGNNQAKSSAADIVPESAQVEITTSRVVSIRYKIYLLVLIGLILLGLFNYVLPAYDAFQNTRQQSADMDQQMALFQTKKKWYDSDAALIELINKQESTIVSCLNQQTSCNQIDQKLRDNFSFARSFVQLNNLQDPKMEINEKILLANINSFLLRDLSGMWSGGKNGVINSINIGESKPVVKALYSVPVRLNITFENKAMLLSFLDNVEKRVLPDKNYRVLYKIKEVAYDIANYNKQQQVDVYLYAYYYKE